MSGNASEHYLQAGREGRTIEYGDEATVLVVADSESAAARASDTVVRGGCRAIATVSPGSAAGHLNEIATRSIFIEIDGDPDDLLDQLIADTSKDGETGSWMRILSVPMASVDRAAAYMSDPGLIILCEASEAERLAALATITARRPVRLHDVGREDGAEKLQQLGEEVGRIANALASISERASLGVTPRGAHDAESQVPAINSSQIRAVIRARRLRDQYFSPQLFADPAWDMLLDLMAARLERQRVAVSSLCIAAMVPPTTALRWIKTLTDHGLFVRHADPQDGRRVHVELADDAAAAMEAYLRAAFRITPVPV